MSMRWVIGRAGGGKTTLLHDRVVEHMSADPLRRSTIIIVPKQSTFNTQRRLSADRRLNGYINIRVISPDDLGELALVETGHANTTRVDRVGRELILNYLLKENADRLQYLSKSADQHGLATLVDEAFAEFEQAGRDLTDTEALIASTLDSDLPAGVNLAKKLLDLRLIYTLYQTFLADHGFDAFDRQLIAPDAVRRCESVRKSLVIVDDFYDLSAYERSLLVAAAGTAPDMFMTLLADPADPSRASPGRAEPASIGGAAATPVGRDVDDTNLFARPMAVFRRMNLDLSRAGIAVEPPVLLRTSRRLATGSSLAAIESGFDRAQPVSVPADGHIRLALASDMTDEVNAAARQVLAHLRNGLRFRDITLLARSLTEYEPYIDAAFAEHGISYFVDRRRQAVHHPLVRAISGLMMTILSRWSHESVMMFVRSGFMRAINDNDIDLLDHYILQHNIPQAAWESDQPWDYHQQNQDHDSSARSLFTERELQQVNIIRSSLRGVIGGLGTQDWFETGRSVRQRTGDLFAFLERLGARTTMEALIDAADKKQDVQQREEHEQVWKRITDLSDALIDLLGDQVVDGGRFADLYLSMLSTLDVAIAPPTLDQVLVGTVDRTRTINPKAVILLGMNFGQFPRPADRQRLLDDDDRRALEDAGIEVQPSARRQALDEQFLGYLAVTRTGGHLTMLRTMADDDGNPIEPSPFWQTVRRCVNDLPVDAPAGAINALATPRQVITLTLNWARTQRRSTAVDADVAAVYQWLTGLVPLDQTDSERSATTESRIARTRDRTWAALRYDNAPTLHKTTAGRLFSSPLQGSVARFESFAACPFQHFASHGLRLTQIPTSTVTPLDMGLLYHAVVERLVRQTIDKRADFASTNEITPELIHAVTTEVADKLRNRLFLSTAANRFSLDRLETVVKRMMAAQQFIATKGSLRPAATELVFGMGGQLSPMTIESPAGNTVVLRGRIDRLDIEEGRGLFSVIDYKSKSTNLRLSHVAHQLTLQLLTYLLVVEANGQSLRGRPLTPMAALYVQMMRDIESTNSPLDKPLPGEEEFLTKNKPSGLINVKHIDQLDCNFSETAKSASYNACRNKGDGSLSKVGNDAVEEEEFRLLMSHVRRSIGELADRVIGGDISVTPYLIGSESPCARCSYKRVCRFDLLINRWSVLPTLKDDQAMELIRDRTSDSEAADDTGAA